MIRGIKKDIANYSLPLLSIQRNKGIISFLKYSYTLSQLGLKNYPIFWFYFLLILTLNNRLTERLIDIIKSVYGYAPHLGLKIK